MSSLSLPHDQMATLSRIIADLQEALASRVEEVTLLQQEVITAVEQRDTLALFLAPRRYLLEEESQDIARDCLAIVEDLFGAVPEAPSPPAPMALSHLPAADAVTVFRGSFWNRDAPSSLHHRRPQHYQTPPPPTALSPAPAPTYAISLSPSPSPSPIASSSVPDPAENDYHMLVYGIPLRPLSNSGPPSYHPLIAAATTTTTAFAARGPPSPPSAPVSLASSPGPATLTPPRAQSPATINTTAATAGSTASERAAGSAELRRLCVRARNMEEGAEEAEMRDRGSPVPRNRAERNWVRAGGVRRGGVRAGGVDVPALPPPRMVWPGE
ncbi:hypothetical protein MMC26_005509 [Xylographa opegraphella]|nr:hypothetical protein [Xylographa opegraphella]